MARALDQLFQIDLVLAEGGLGLALRLGDFMLQVLAAADNAHTAPAATPGSLEHNREAHLLGHLGDPGHIVRQRLRCRNHRHTDLNGQVAGSNLVAKAAHGLGLRPNEDNAVFRTGFGEFRALRQKAVAWMNGIRARKFGNADHLIDRQIALDGAEIAFQMRPAPNLIGFVRLEPVQRILVLLGPDGHRSDIEFIGCAKDADGDFGTVCDEDLLNLHWQELREEKDGAGLPGAKLPSAPKRRGMISVDDAAVQTFLTWRKIRGFRRGDFPLCVFLPTLLSSIGALHRRHPRRAGREPGRIERRGRGPQRVRRVMPGRRPGRVPAHSANGSRVRPGMTTSFSPSAGRRSRQGDEGRAVPCGLLHL